jgi:hypothetical protein
VPLPLILNGDSPWGMSPTSLSKSTVGGAHDTGTHHCLLVASCDSLIGSGTQLSLRGEASDVDTGESQSPVQRSPGRHRHQNSALHLQSHNARFLQAALLHRPGLDTSERGRLRNISELLLVWPTPLGALARCESVSIVVQYWRKLARFYSRLDEDGDGLQYNIVLIKR